MNSDEPPRLIWDDRLSVLGWYAAGIAGAALFPRLAYWARWPTRLGTRGRIAYAAFNALLLFAIRQGLQHVRHAGEGAARGDAP